MPPSFTSGIPPFSLGGAKNGFNLDRRVCSKWCRTSSISGVGSVSSAHTRRWIETRRAEGARLPCLVAATCQPLHHGHVSNVLLIRVEVESTQVWPQYFVWQARNCRTRWCPNWPRLSCLVHALQCDTTSRAARHPPSKHDPPASDFPSLYTLYFPRRSGAHGGRQRSEQPAVIVLPRGPKYQVSTVSTLPSCATIDPNLYIRAAREICATAPCVLDALATLILTLTFLDRCFVVDLPLVWPITLPLV